MQLDNWSKFSKTQQIGAIGAEIMRAKNWQEKDKDKFLSAIERTLKLVDLSIDDIKWRNNIFMLFTLRDELAKFYAGIAKNKIERLYNAI